MKKTNTNVNINKNIPVNFLRDYLVVNILTR